MTIINVQGTRDGNRSEIMRNKKASRMIHIRGGLPTKRDGMANEVPACPLEAEKGSN